MKKIIITAFIALLFLCLGRPVFARSIYWNCPHSGCSFQLQCAPGDDAYMRSLAQQHLATHQSSGSGGNYGYSGGGSGDPVFDACMPVLESIFQSIGQDMAETLFGSGPNPEEQRRIEEEQRRVEAERARLQAEQEAAAREEARRKEEQHRKLVASLKKLPDSGALGLKTISDTSGTLSLKGLPDTPLVSGGSILENLQRAAFISKQAAGSSSKEQSSFLSEQAFRAADGAKLYVNVPDVGPGVDVTPEEVKIYAKMQEKIRISKLNQFNLSKTIAQKHEQRKVFKKAKEAAKENVKKHEEKIKALPPETIPEQKTIEEDKLAEAQRLLNEAIGFEEKASQNLEILQEKSNELNKEITQVENERREFVTNLSKK